MKYVALFFKVCFYVYYIFGVVRPFENFSMKSFSYYASMNTNGYIGFKNIEKKVLQCLWVNTCHIGETLLHALAMSNRQFLCTHALP